MVKRTDSTKAQEHLGNEDPFPCVGETVDGKKEGGADTSLADPWKKAPEEGSGPTRL